MVEVYKAFGSQSDVEAIICDHGDGAPTVILPFRDETVSSFARVGDDRIVVAGSKGALAIYHVSGRLLAEARSATPFVEAFVQGDKLLLRGLWHLSCWSIEPLAEHWSGDCMVINGRDATLSTRLAIDERNGKGTYQSWWDEGAAIRLSSNQPTQLADGRVFLPLADFRQGVSYGYCIVGPDGIEEGHIVDRMTGGRDAFISVSPSGRYALRCNDDQPHPDGAKSLLSDLGVWGFGRRKPQHPDAKPDGRERVGIVLDLWELGPLPKLAERLVVRMVEPDLLRRTGIEQLRHLVATVLWEPGELGFWLEFKNAVLRRVGVDGSLSPFITFRRWQTKSDPLAISSLRFLGREMKYTTDGRITFSANAEGSVSFDPRIASHAGGIVTIEPDDDRFRERTSWAKFIDKAARERTFVRQKLRAMSEASINTALLELAAAVDGRVRDLCWGNLLRFRFVHAGKSIKEEDLFVTILENGWTGTLPGLKALLAAYLNGFKGGEGSQPWFDSEEGTGALAHALRAQVFLDPSDLSLWQLYLSKRDTEHETYVLDRLLPDYLSRFGDGAARP